MDGSFGGVDDAIAVLADSSRAACAEAVRFRSGNQETTRVMIGTFQLTLERKGGEPSATDPDIGEPKYRLEDVACAMGVANAELDPAAF